MTSRLPETIEPFKLAERSLTLTGTIDVSRMKRLLPSLVEPDGEVSVLLDFYKDEVGRPVMHGKLSTELSMCCQRCMQAMPVKIDTDVHFALRTIKQGEDGTCEDLEVLIVEDSSLSLNDFVEDETILALPLVAMHKPQDCSAKLAEDEPDKEKKPNPFAVLAELKQRK